MKVTRKITANKQTATPKTIKAAGSVPLNFLTPFAKSLGNSSVTVLSPHENQSTHQIQTSAECRQIQEINLRLLVQDCKCRFHHECCAKAKEFVPLSFEQSSRPEQLPLPDPYARLRTGWPYMLTICLLHAEVLRPPMGL